MLATLLILTIPVVGGAFLYSELRWGKFMHKSVGYGALYALAVLATVLVDAQTRFMWRSLDAVLDGRDVQTLQYVAPVWAAERSLEADKTAMERKLKLEVVATRLEEIALDTSHCWVVIKARCKPREKMPKKSLTLEKILHKRSRLVMQAAKPL